MKCLNTRAKLTIQKLYEAMYHKPHMIEEGIYAKINNNPAYMPVIVEKVGHLHGYGEIISIAHYGQQNGDPMADPDMEFVIIGGDYYPISYRNDYLCQTRRLYARPRRQTRENQQNPTRTLEQLRQPLDAEYRQSAKYYLIMNEVI